MRKTRRIRQAGHDILEPDTRQDRHPVPRGLAMSGDLVAAPGQLVAEQVRKRIVGELRLLEADDVRLPLVEPRQQARHALLQRVDVPGGDPHGSRRYREIRGCRFRRLPLDVQVESTRQETGAAVSATVLYMSMSLDGFIAGPNEGPGNGLGDGGHRLHDWALRGADGEAVPRPSGVNGQIF